MATVVIKKPRHQATKFVLTSAYFLTSESAGNSSTHEDNHRQNTCTGRKFNQPPAFGTPFVSHPAYAVVLCAWRNCASRRAGGAGYCLTRRQHSRWTERPLKSHHPHFQYGNWFRFTPSQQRYQLQHRCWSGNPPSEHRKHSADGQEQ